MVDTRGEKFSFEFAFKILDTHKRRAKETLKMKKCRCHLQLVVSIVDTQSGSFMYVRYLLSEIKNTEMSVPF